MAQLTPTVQPAVNSAGISISTHPKILYDRAIEEGLVNKSNFFIVAINKTNPGSIEDYLQTTNIITDIVPAQTVHERLNPVSGDPENVLDFGDDPDSGEQYASRVTIKPDNPLNPNTNYAVILSKNISKRTVFDPEPGNSNSGTGQIEAFGPFSRLQADTYTITIVASGGKNSSQYVWSRASDSVGSVALSSSQKTRQIDSGIGVRFKDGTYEVGDTFTIRVIPQVKQTSLYSWTFSTGAGEYQVPEDEKSGNVVNLPVQGQTSTVSDPVDDPVEVVETKPEMAASLVKVATLGYVKLGDVLFTTKEETKDFNGVKISIIDGATAGSEVVTVVDPKLIEIQIENEVSTAKQIVDAFNSSAANNDFNASTLKEDKKQKSGVKGRIMKGVNPNKFEIFFSKDIDVGSLEDNIVVTSQNIYPPGPEDEIYFEQQVDGNKLTILFVD